MCLGNINGVVFGWVNFKTLGFLLLPYDWMCLNGWNHCLWSSSTMPVLIFVSSYEWKLYRG
jgi:hypothetical protein